LNSAGEREKFGAQERGIYLPVKAAAFDKEEGGDGFVRVTLDNPEFHGLVNGRQR
jgi:hypothetical protein